MESVKKGVLKVDLQALTVGVAVLSMAAWLSGARDSVLHDSEPSLDASRKLAIVNGLAEQTRAQVCFCDERASKTCDHSVLFCQLLLLQLHLQLWLQLRRLNTVAPWESLHPLR